MKELLFSVTKKDLVITWFSGKGAGGQHRNKHQNCCRIKHPESNVITTGQNNRSRERNLKDAFMRLTEHEKFKTWLRLKAAETTVDKDQLEKEIQKAVDNAMREENIKVEYLE